MRRYPWARRRRRAPVAPYCPWPLPAGFQAALRAVPPGFTDDGCSGGPDAVAGLDFSVVCLLHDVEYCTRANPPGGMNVTKHRLADARLRVRCWHLLRHERPVAAAWMPLVYFQVLRAFGRAAYDSCGPRPQGATAGQMVRGLCRHSLPMPAWMRADPYR